MEELKDSRRTLLKNTGKGVAFVIPAMLTFNVSSLKAQVSQLPDGKINVSAEFPDSEYGKINATVEFPD